MARNSFFGEDLFDDFFNGFPFDNRPARQPSRGSEGPAPSHIMRTDILEKEEHYVLEIDLPGYKKEDLKVSLEKGYLTVSAAKNHDNQTQEPEKGRYIRRERYIGACKRTFYVGEYVRQEDIKAEFVNGILKLTVPKKNAKAIQEKNYISIE